MKVSVITTVWNVEPYIEKTIRSIINQTLEDIELVLINDCSPDNSIDILNKYADQETKQEILDMYFSMFQEITKEEYESMITFKP